MPNPEIAFILPQYNKFCYSRRAALSFFKYTDKGFCIVIDDCSPWFDRQDWASWGNDLPLDRMLFHRCEKNRGLTNAWNWGLTKAREFGINYTICGNSDILFSPGWSRGLLHHLQNGYDLVGPVTNTPGVTNKGLQSIAHYYPDYKALDDASYIAAVAEHLRSTIPVEQAVRVDINGFFLMALTHTWWAGRFDNTHVFNPSKKMVGNEDELQKRWKRTGRRVGFVPSSFIFHYRSVSRGKQFNEGPCARLADAEKPV